jgi:hypothetical protein
VYVVSSSNNTTQVQNFTIEWLNFDIFECATPATVDVSIFSCVAPDYTQVEDISCLQVTTIDLQEITCQSNATTTTVNIISFKKIIMLLETNALWDGGILNSKKKKFSYLDYIEEKLL